MSAKKTTALAVLLLVSVLAYILACSQATWSPDGKRIAFVDPPTDNEKGCSLVVWDGETGTTRVLLQAGSPLGSPGWSPDGKMLAVVNYGQINPPKAADAGSAVKAESAAKAANATTAESAAKAENAAESPKQGLGRLFLVNVADGTSRLLDEAKPTPPYGDSEWEACPQWTEDGKMIAWSLPNVWQVRLVDAKSGRLVKVIENALDPVISPSRKLMAMFEKSSGDKPDGVAIFDLEKMERRSLVKFDTPQFRVAAAEALAWSPDSSQLLIAGQPMKKVESAKPGEEQWSVFSDICSLWTVAVSDGRMTLLAKDLSDIASANWALKGDHIALTMEVKAKQGEKDGGGSGGVWLMKADGTDLRRIDSARGDDMAFYPAFSPDGTRLCYQMIPKKPKATSVVVYDIAAGTEKVVYTHYSGKLPALDEAVKIEEPVESGASAASAASATSATSAAPAK